MKTSINMLINARIKDDSGAWRQLVGAYEPLIEKWIGQIGVKRS